MATQVKGAASSSTAPCISDDEEEEDEVKKDLPLPPPPPPPIPSTTSTEPLVFQRQRERIAEVRNLRLAARFHRQVVLMRCIQAWHNQTEITKQMLQDAYRIMKRTLLLWHDEAMRLIEQREALSLFHSIASRCQRRLLASAFNSWDYQAKQDKLIESTFVAWREETRAELVTFKENETAAIRFSHRTLMKSTFSNWKDEALVSTHRKHSNRKTLHNNITAWRARTDCETETRQEALKAITKQRRDQTMKRVFGVWRLDASTTTMQRDAISTVMRISNESIQRQILFTWLSICVTCTRFDMASAILSNIADKVHIRGALISWVDVTALIVQKEKIVLATILNRWSMLVEERKHRRALNEMALQHWACNVCKRTLRQWKASVEEIREEQKATFRRSMHSTSHSLRMSSSMPPPRQLALPSLSLLSNSSNRNGIASPLNSGLVKTNFLTGSINSIRPSTDSLKAISTQHASPIRTTSPTTRHETITSHRTQMLAKQWTSPTTAQQQTRQLLPQLNEVRISSTTNTNSSARGGSPFGVRVPRWIQEEISGRCHQSHMVPRYR